MKYSHYFREVPKGVTHIDIYRLLQMFGVTDAALGHAIKKLIVPGLRGAKDVSKDVTEARDTLNRWLEMRKEEQGEDEVMPKKKIPEYSGSAPARLWRYVGGNFKNVGIMVCLYESEDGPPVGFRVVHASSYDHAAKIFSEKEQVDFPYPTRA